jgi:hypothetical protein
MNMVAYTDTSALQKTTEAFVAPPDEAEMSTGPLDGLRVLDLVSFAVVELAAGIVSASGSLLAEAVRKLTDLGTLLGSVSTAHQHVADDVRR